MFQSGPDFATYQEQSSLSFRTELSDSNNTLRMLSANRNGIRLFTRVTDQFRNDVPINTNSGWIGLIMDACLMRLRLSWTHFHDRWKVQEIVADSEWVEAFYCGRRSGDYTITVVRNWGWPGHNKVFLWLTQRQRIYFSVLVLMMDALVKFRWSHGCWKRARR